MKINYIFLITILFGFNSLLAQENKFQVELGAVGAPSRDIDTDYVYFTDFASPMLRLDLGYEMFDKSNLRIVPKIGITRGVHNYIRYSTNEEILINFPDRDSIYVKKQRVYTFLSLSTEFKRYFKIPHRGFYIYGEPQIQFILSANQTFVERVDGVETINESSNLKDRYHSVTLATKLGLGYDLKVNSEFSVFIAFEFLLYPWRGHSKLGDLTRNVRGLKVGVNF